MIYNRIDEERRAPMIGTDCLPGPDDAPKLASAAELARWFGVSPRTVVNWSKQGILPRPLRISPRKTLWNVEQVREALKRLEEESWSTTGGRGNGEIR